MATSHTSLVTGNVYHLISALYLIGWLNVLYLACKAAYEIRLHAITEYGRVIHEFDPYFNYRATEYLWANGWRQFFHWFDYQSWYPLGRPVGTTIYPGMQFTSVWIKQFILPDWSINDICCFVPAWFGVLATLFTAALCYVTVDSIKANDDDHSEANKSNNRASRSLFTDIPIISSLTRVVIIPIFNAVFNLLEKVTGSKWGIPTFENPPALECAVFTACIMSIVPAHLLRSVGGGYDNESVATTAMQLTFFSWAWTLSSRKSDIHTAIMGTISGICYFYMVSSWGGYVFVINLIGVHALSVFLLRKTSFSQLYYAYTSFYVVGTFLAMQIPVVNWTPLKSLEQLGPFGVFAGFQALQLMRICEARYKQYNKWLIRLGVILAGIIVALPVVYKLYTSGYFGPISARVRGLFVKHTKTGNPLVDSVAEHQAASPQAYYQYLHETVNIAPVGFAIIGLFGCTAPSSFLLMYSVTAYFFSHKMVRLVLLTAPIASICGGIALGYLWAWGIGGIFGDARPSFRTFLLGEDGEDDDGEVVSPKVEAQTEQVTQLEATQNKKRKGKDKDKKKKKLEKVAQATLATEDDAKAVVVVKAEPADDAKKGGTQTKVNKSKGGDPLLVRGLKIAATAWVIQQIIPKAQEFHSRSNEMARAISHPTIITKGRNKHTGEEVVVDDYRQAYFWLRDHTPEDARIMAWWDYGYQITGISNRTTIADGNTWNHEHIALLGRILTGPEKDSHRIARHLADYVLVWAGGGGDDVAKSPHLLRIANSVYRGLCKEPTCRHFGMTRTGQPSQALGESLLYKLHSHGIVPGVEADRNRFRPVFSSKYGKVRIFKIMSVSQESKQWVLNNRQCDVPGSWYCPGQYPPALTKILKEKKDFGQLEDFNVKATDEEYQRQYFENLNKKGPAQGDRKQHQQGSASKSKAQLQKIPWDQIEMLNEDWGNTDQTSLMWEIISNGQWQDFLSALSEDPLLAHVRSEDGRGPMFWAHEYGRPHMVRALKQMGVSEDRSDAKGIRPVDISTL